MPQRDGGLGKWEHGLSVPRESVTVAAYKRGLLNDYLSLNVAGVRIGMGSSRRPLGSPPSPI